MTHTGVREVIAALWVRVGKGVAEHFAWTSAMVEFPGKYGATPSGAFAPNGAALLGVLSPLSIYSPGITSEQSVSFDWSCATKDSLSIAAANLDAMPV